MENYTITPVLDEPDFKQKKILQFPIIEKYNYFLPKKSNQMFECGRSLHFGLFQHLQDYTHEKRLESMFTCKDKFCPFCNWRRARKLAIQSYELLEAIQKKENIRYIFLTLTVKNPRLEDTKSTIQEMNKAFQRMHQTMRFKNAIAGFCRILEIHPQKDDTNFTHPHFHCILAVRSSYFKNIYIKQDEWQEMWKNALRVDYNPSVDVRIIKADNEHDPIAKVVAEAFKYPMKSSSLDALSWQEFEILYNQLFRSRFISYGGILKQYREALGQEDVEMGDLIHELERDAFIWKKIADIYYNFQDGKYGLDYYPSMSFEQIEYKD